MNEILFIAIAIGILALGLLLKYIYALKQQARKAQAKAASLEDESTRLWTTQSELSKEAQRLQGEVDRLSAENQDLRQRSDILQNLEATQAELAQINATLGQRKREQATLDQHIAQHQGRLGQLRSEENTLQARQGILHQAQQALDEEKTSLNRVLYSLQQQLKKLHTDQQSLDASCTDLEHRQHQLRKDIGHHEAQKKSLDQEIDQLQKNLEFWREENRKIEDKHIKILDRDQRLEAHPDLIQQQEELTQRIEGIEQEKADLSEQLWQAQAQIERDLQGLHRIKIIAACRQHSTSDQELFHAKITMDFSRVREALDFAETMFGDVLEVWDSARVSADVSNFIRPDDAYRALQGLAWFGQYYFERDGDIGDNLYGFLRERYNLECTPESKTVENDKKLRDERCFWHGNQRKEMFKHLKLGGGRGMNNILRIYFNINRESRKIEIGHCGKHLSN